TICSGTVASSRRKTASPAPRVSAASPPTSGPTATSPNNSSPSATASSSLSRPPDLHLANHPPLPCSQALRLCVFATDMPSSATVERETAETEVRLVLELDGTGEARVATGVGFLDHMLTLFARHGLFDLEVAATGDLEVDQHHTVEDVGICLGQALARAV